MISLTLQGGYLGGVLGRHQPFGALQLTEDMLDYAINALGAGATLTAPVYRRIWGYLVMLSQDATTIPQAVVAQGLQLAGVAPGVLAEYEAFIEFALYRKYVFGE